MQETKKLNFVNQHIYVGIDVHAKRWVTSIICGDLFLGTFSQDPETKMLINYLKRNYPGGIYHSVYESGFSGFWIYEELRSEGIECIVVNAADVPTTGKEKDRKTDKVDSRKLAWSLSRGELKGIYVHNKEHYEQRSLIRTRESLVKDQTRCKNRIKGLMKFFGIEIAEEQIRTHWSNKYVQYLENLETEYLFAKISLKSYLDQLKYYRRLISDITKQIRKLSQTEKYKQNIDLLKTIPGISTLTAMTLLVELGDIERFNNLDRLCGYIGLIPSEHSTGEDQRRNFMTKRGNGTLKAMIIESSWVAIRKDPVLLNCYTHLSKRMRKTRAIITISKKLISRIMFVLRQKQEYKFSFAK